MCAGAAPGQVQPGSGEGSEGFGGRLRGFGAEPHIQQVSGEGSGESCGEGCGERLGGFRAEPVRLNRVPEKGFGELWCRGV